MESSSLIAVLSSGYEGANEEHEKFAHLCQSYAQIRDDTNRQTDLRV